uniref:Structural polyprotein n=1 Tax=PNG bee virus 11 TaxID=2746870 RepID=A0A7D4XI03_9VIRU|nr:structural polyprotein [PNG bee virus 11]
MDTKINQQNLFNPTSSREINTINLEHNEPLVEHTLGRSHSTLSSGKSESISDPGSITTTELFTKPIVFSPNLEWSVDQTVNTVLYSQPLLSIFETLVQSPGGQALRAHTFFRSGAKVQLKLTSSPFHSGKLIFYYIPPGVSQDFRESVFAKAQYPCVYVDAGNSTTGELDIPFVAIKDFFATYNHDRYSDFGDIGVAVFNTLAIGTGGQTTINFALSLHPTQNQIALPVLAHDISLQAGIATVIASVLPEVLPSLMEGAAPILGAAGAGAVAGGTIASVVGDYANDSLQKENNNQIKMIEDLNNLGVSNKNNTTSTKDLNISAPSLSNMAGLGTEHLSLYPEKTFVKHAPSHSLFDDEMDLQRVAKVPSLLQIRNWSDTDTPNTVLFKTNIDPMCVPATVTTNSVFTVYPTYLAHVSSPFAYWRGSIDYHFTFASTEQHKGKVIAAWIPFDRIIDDVSQILNDPTVETLSLFPNEIFDLSLNKEFNFSVPYNSETPYRKVNDYYSRIRPDDNVVDDSGTSTTLGTLYLAVYNRLSHPTTVTPTIQFNVYIRAGSDYQLRALRFSTGEVDTHEQIRYVSIQGLEVAMESSRGGMLVMPENRVGRANTHVSNTSFQDDDSEHHLGFLLSKYYPQLGAEFTLAANTTRRISIANLPGLTHRAPRVATEADPRWRNLINHFRDIYAFWHGSLNYFIIHNSTVNNPILLIASHDPDGETASNLLIPSGATNQRNDTYASISTVEQEQANVDISETSVYSHISNLRVNPTIEVTTPYRSIYRRLYNTGNRIGASDYADFSECAGTLDLLYSNPSGTDIPISAMIFQSVGSDFRFKYLIPPPSLRSR